MICDALSDLPGVTVVAQASYGREVGEYARYYRPDVVLAEAALPDCDGVELTRLLVLSPATVYSHIKSLLRKLDVHSWRDAVEAAGRLRREEAALDAR